MIMFEADQCSCPLCMGLGHTFLEYPHWYSTYDSMFLSPPIQIPCHVCHGTGHVSAITQQLILQEFEAEKGHSNTKVFPVIIIAVCLIAFELLALVYVFKM